MQMLFSDLFGPDQPGYPSSLLDDPVMWGAFKGSPFFDPDFARWVLAAEDICFKNPVYSYIFRIGKCIPITRGGGIFQEHMNEALERLKDGAWLHTFPEGKVFQEDFPIRRLKWGTASLIARCPVTPIVLPIIHRGFEEVMPENYFRGKRPPVPLCGKNICIVIGQPIEFDLPEMVDSAVSASRLLDISSLPTPETKWPLVTVGGSRTSRELDEASQRCLYAAISEKIQTAMEKLRLFAKRCSSS
ncbi:PREDICTED: N-acylphosphatidylethanolamine synthase isoform X2 [Tarenaya hassleriana]|uniref:N-acylphosphatidylethanolamine synthase isoform X2 n=1 Tax=Tarenaya hassleriana TaxID=28532 RepID=UPI00053C5185|nr:PREDICTED: N-acylphosphatidylethanolamine synthase isoform X2 [Tarenaya hassleriana]